MTNDGFKIAEKDLELRGPGDIQGTRQSGALEFKLADIVADKVLLEFAKQDADLLLSNDPDLKLPDHESLAYYLRNAKSQHPWAKIS
jgi:ATP-dependent DNA helicase RecG